MGTRSRILANSGSCPHNSVHLIDPLGYLDFLKLMAHARIVLTDSGGIQEETTILGTPCLTLRENTERPVTVEMGTNRLVGSDPVRILEAYREVMAGNGMAKRPGGLPNTSSEDDARLNSRGRRFRFLRGKREALPSLVSETRPGVAAEALSGTAPSLAAVLHLRPGLFLACAPAEAEIGGQPWDSAPIS
jgi:hypothetical protein